MNIVSRIAVAALALAAAPAAQAGEFYFPGNAETRAGGSNQSFPFNIGAGSQRYQQLYLGSLFGAAPVTLDAVMFRQASDATGGSPFSTTLPNISIGLSTATTRVGAIGTGFAGNIGADAATVFSGALALGSTAPARRDFTAQPFDVVIRFAAPFTFDPRRGDLLLDIVNLGGGTSTQLDFITGGSTVFSRAFTLPGQAATTPTGFAQQGAGLVTAFSTVAAVGAVPEPSTWAMMLIGFGAIGGGLRSRRRGSVATA